MLDRRQFIASLPLISGAARALAVGLPIEEPVEPAAATAPSAGQRCIRIELERSAERHVKRHPGSV